MSLGDIIICAETHSSSFKVKKGRWMTILEYSKNLTILIVLQILIFSHSSCVPFLTVLTKSDGFSVIVGPVSLYFKYHFVCISRLTRTGLICSGSKSFG
jgi:hypothetical protein